MSAPTLTLSGMPAARVRRSRLATMVLIGGGALVTAAALFQSGPYGPAAAAALAVIGIGLAWQVRHLSLGAALVLSTVAGFVLLNRGFGYIGVSVGPAPLLVGELTIAAALLLLPHGRVLPQFARDPMAAWLALWFLWGGLVLSLQLNALTFDVAKDASIVYYPLFLYFGYVVASFERNRKTILRVLGLTFLLFLVYIFGFPWDVAIQDASPRVLMDLGLFGHYNTAYVHVLGGALFFVILGPRVFPRLAGGICLALGALFLGTLLFVQSRAGVLGAVACLGLLLFLGYRGRFVKLSLGLFVLAVLVAFANARGVTLQGWKAPATLDFLSHMVETTFGAGTDEYEAGLHATRESRFQMWRTAIEPNLASPAAFLFGNGFGDLLVDIELNTGWIKRSPHNSFVTIFARVGLVGLAIFVGLHQRFLSVVWRAIRRTRLRGRTAQRQTLSFLLVYYTAFTMGALFSVVYDTPYMAAPCYFAMGLAYCIARQELKRST